MNIYLIWFPFYDNKDDHMQNGFCVNTWKELHIYSPNSSFRNKTQEILKLAVL